jgi:hypothetical protein
MWTTTFWKDAVERALKTFLQVFVATYGVTNATDMFVGASLAETFWLALATAVISLATSAVSTGIGDGDSASLVNAKSADNA